MAQEVYAVIFVNKGDDSFRVELRQVFDSLEKARAYCENPDHYTDGFSEVFLGKFDPSWNDSGKVYSLFKNDDKNIYFFIDHCFINDFL